MLRTIVAECLVLVLAALAADAAVVRAVRSNTSTFRAVRGAPAAPAAASPAMVSFAAPTAASFAHPSPSAPAGRGFVAATNAERSAGRGLSGSSKRFVPFRTSWSRRADDPPPAEEGPRPVAGALIRTAGSGYRVSPGGPFGILSVDGGSGFIQDRTGQGLALEGPGIQQGRPDGSTSSSANSRAGNNGASIRADTVLPP